ncbi:DNA glycosylase AlkZ-like family protein [Streptomyces celluloflavus]|uniref:DNA glycosylase AlkZ-like family protein n=1 Tax=Streptomyces celluloflavus TaxID=58344 RepID=UPI0036A0D766
MSGVSGVGDPAATAGGAEMARLRAWWWHRQGLDGRLRGARPDAVLAETGWARSVGGSGPYLGLFARAGADRAAVDGAVARLEIHELPSARGCTYVLPAADYALGLRAGASAPEADLAAAVKHLGVTEREIDALGTAVLGALTAAGAPLDPTALKKVVGPAVRSLGEAGRKRGVTTTLPLALGLLQARGAIHRVPVNGRLDQQRYGYVRWLPSPLGERTSTGPGRTGDVPERLSGDAGPDRAGAAPVSLPSPTAGPDGSTEAVPDVGRDAARSAADRVRAELARRYFAWAGPASLRHFRWFSNLTAAATKTAVAGLGLVPLPDPAPVPDGSPTGAVLLATLEQAAALADFAVPKQPQYALLAGNDGIHLLHRDFGRLLDPADADRAVPGGKPGSVLGPLSDPPTHMILDRGRLVGLWEYDPDAAAIVWTSFIRPDAALRAAVATTEVFIRDQLGDARSFSLDSPKSRAPRMAALRKGGA